MQTGNPDHSWLPTDFGRAEACCLCYLVVSKSVFDNRDYPTACVELECSEALAHRLDYTTDGVACVYCATPFGQGKHTARSSA